MVAAFWSLVVLGALWCLILMVRAVVLLVLDWLDSRRIPDWAAAGDLTFSDDLGLPVFPAPDRPRTHPTHDQAACEHVATDEIDRRFEVMATFLAADAPPVMTKSLRIAAWEKASWHRATSTMLALDLHQSEVPVVGVGDLVDRLAQARVQRHLRLVATEPANASAVRDLADALTDGQLPEDSQPARLHLAVVRVRTLSGASAAPSDRAYLRVTHRSSSQVFAVPVWEDDDEKEDGTPEGGDGSGAALAAALCPPPGAGSDLAWAQQLGQSGRLLRHALFGPSPITAAARLAAPNTTRPPVAFRPPYGLSAQSRAPRAVADSPHPNSRGQLIPPTTSSKPSPSLSHRQRPAALGGLPPVPVAATRRVVGATRSGDIIITGAQAHQSLTVVGLGWLIPASTVDIRNTDAVASGRHNRIVHRAYFHIERVTLDWSQWSDAAARLRPALRRVVADPSDDAAVRKVQAIARSLTPDRRRPESRTTTRTVTAGVNLMIRGCDVTSIGNYGRIDVEKDYVIRETALPVVALMARDPDMVCAYADVVAGTGNRTTFLDRTLSAARHLGHDDLLAGIAGAARETLMESLFTTERAKRAAGVVVGRDNWMEFRQQLREGPTSVNRSFRSTPGVRSGLTPPDRTVRRNMATDPGTRTSQSDRHRPGTGIGR